MLEYVKSGSIHIITVSIPLHELSTTWNCLNILHVFHTRLSNFRINFFNFSQCSNSDPKTRWEDKINSYSAITRTSNAIMQLRFNHLAPVDSRVIHDVSVTSTSSPEDVYISVGL